MWHIFAFDIHMRWHVVQKLNFHLPDDQVVCFGDQEKMIMFLLETMKT